VIPGIPSTSVGPSGQQVVIRDYGGAPGGAALTSFESDVGVAPAAAEAPKKSAAGWLLAALGALSILR
jgi:hypothetical protein